MNEPRIWPDTTINLVEYGPTIERDHDDGRIIVIDGALLAEIVGEGGE